MVAAAILDFNFFHFSTVRTVKKIKLRLCVKFCRNCSIHVKILKFQIFEISKIRDGGNRHHKSPKIAISQQRFDQSARNLAWLRILVPCTVQHLRFPTFKNPRLGTATVFKNRKI